MASASGQPITGGATTLKPDLKLADVKVDDYAGLVFPCMAVPDAWEPPPESVEIAKKAVAQGKPVAAQVGGVATLAAAGVLNGKQYCFPGRPRRPTFPGVSTKARVSFKMGISSLLGLVLTWRRDGQNGRNPRADPEVD